MKLTNDQYSFNIPDEMIEDTIYTGAGIVLITNKPIIDLEENYLQLSKKIFSLTDDSNNNILLQNIILINKHLSIHDNSCEYRYGFFTSKED